MRFKNALKKFAYETFRPHSREEYAELFSRGKGGDEKPTYPWFYARVLLFSLLLFTVLCVSYSLSKLNFLLVLLTGGIFADLAFIILLFEIYPKRDQSLATFILVFIAGGILSSALIYVQYGLLRVDVEFAEQAWTAFVEETGKAVTIIIILLILKKRDPLVCFIVGAAVGGGYSAFENMWRMYVYGYGYGGISSAIENGLWRALGTPFSHAAWAGLFGWALSDKRPWFSRKPYAMYAFGYVMHFFVNFPEMPQFKTWYGYSISAVTGILTIVVMILVIVKCRRALIGCCVQGEQLSIPQIESYPQTYGGYPKINGAYITNKAEIHKAPLQPFVGYGACRYKFIANVLAAAAIFCFSFALLGPTCVFGGYTYYTIRNYDAWGEVLYIVQNGHEFNPDYNREYVELKDPSENYSYTWTNGKLTSVVQRQSYGSYNYRYTYGYVTYYSTFEDEEGNFFVRVNGKDIPIESVDGNLPESVDLWGIKSMSLELNDSLYSPYVIVDYGNSYDMDDQTIQIRTVYRYFILNPMVASVRIADNGTFDVYFNESVPIRKTESVVFTAVFLAAFIGCGVAYIVYKIKIKKLNLA